MKNHISFPRLNTCINYWAKVVQDLTAALPAVRAEWELAEQDWALRLSGADRAVDIARDTYNALLEDLRIAGGHLAALVAEKESKQALHQGPRAGIPGTVRVQPDGSVVIPVLVTPNRKEGSWDLTFMCPWCPPNRGRPPRHRHGGGPIDEPPVLGNRASHCPSSFAPSSYELVPTDQRVVATCTAGDPSQPPARSGIH